MYNHLPFLEFTSKSGKVLALYWQLCCQFELDSDHQNPGRSAALWSSLAIILISEWVGYSPEFFHGNIWKHNMRHDIMIKCGPIFLHFPIKFRF